MIRVRELLGQGILASMIVGVDRLSKVAALSGLLPQHIWPFFACNLTMNRGISCGLFHADAPIFHTTLLTIAIFILIFLLILQVYYRYKNGETYWLYTLIIAGGTSNLVDRFLYGGVIDFIEICYKSWSFPIFNIADVVIVCGVVGMILQEMKK